MMFVIGDFVKIRNSRTDELAEEIFRGFIREIKVQEKGYREGFLIARVKNLHNCDSWELVSDLSLCHSKDLLYVL